MIPRVLLLGVITLTGAGFRVSFMVTQAAASLAASSSAILTILPESVVGTGIPTTALSIVLAAIAASALPVILWHWRKSTRRSAVT
jgi:TRAP-type uncharacterized transport system fused permease subunit